MNAQRDGGKSQQVGEEPALGRREDAEEGPEATRRGGLAVERGGCPPLMLNTDSRKVERFMGLAVGVVGGVVDLQGCPQGYSN